MRNINRTSSIRSGLNYQDYWVIKLAANWLNNPEKYKTLRIEFIPTEIQDKQFFLDDIVFEYPNGELELYQIKHTSIEWTWDRLLLPLKNAKESLIKKWATSLLKSSNFKKGNLITNGNASSAILSYLEKGKVNLKKIELNEPALHKSIVSQFDSDVSAQLFFSKFQFLFNQKDGQQLQLETKKFLKDKLGVTIDGFNNFTVQINTESAKQIPIDFTIESIRKWCDFDKPRPLNENFEIPNDFEYFDKNIHQNIVKQIESNSSGIKVFYGGPGVGKSVYLSNLAKVLESKKIPVIKHHYHISPEDNNHQERLPYKRVEEGLKAQFKKFKKYIGNLDNKNSKEIDLIDFVDKFAESIAKKGKQYVIMIDGLDHVLRFDQGDELEALLQKVCRPQDGLWIIIGMQRVAEKHLPQIIKSKSSEQDWIEVKKLNITSVEEIIKKNSIGLNLPKQKEQLKKLVSRVYQITNGNALHLRYTLGELKHLVNSGVVTEYDCKDIIPYGGDIVSYYEALWNKLTDNSKTVLIAISLLNFKIKESQLIEFLNTYIPATEINSSYRLISHLIALDPQSHISFFHNSFSLFLADHNETKRSKTAILQLLKKWLETSKHDGLRWSSLKIIEYELGNEEEILKINKNWLIESITSLRSSYQISNQLGLASQVAFSKDDFAKTLRISHLSTYYDNLSISTDNLEERIRIESLNTHPELIEDIELNELSITELTNVCELAHLENKQELVKEVIDILINRQYDQEYRIGSIPPLSKALVRTLPFDSEYSLDRIIKYIKGLRSLKITKHLFSELCSILIKLNDHSSVIKLLECGLTHDEKIEVLTNCLLYDINNNETIYLKITDKIRLKSEFIKFYRSIKSKTSPLTKLPDYSSLPVAKTEYDNEERDMHKVFFYNSFFQGINYTLNNKSGLVEEWIKKAPDSWVAQASKSLFKAGLSVGQNLLSEKVSTPSNIMSHLADLKPMVWPDDRDNLILQQALTGAVAELVKLIVNLKILKNTEISLDEYSEIRNSEYYSRNELVNLLISTDKILSEESYNKLVAEVTSDLSANITTLYDRSEIYLNISIISRIQGHSDKAKSFLTKATSSMLGYGNHKDMYIFDVIDSISLCIDKGIDTNKIKIWTELVVPIVENIREFTDGDETRHSENYFAEMTAKHNKPLLYKLYFYRACKEEFVKCEDLFEYIVTSLDYSNNIDRSLALTSISEDAFNALRKTSINDKGALETINRINKYFGNLEFKQDESTSTYSNSENIDYSQVKYEELVDYLKNNLKTRWDLEKYLIGWINHWKDLISPKELECTLKSLLDVLGAKKLPYEILDATFKNIYKVNKKLAFDNLCLAQKNGHGWAKYWVSEGIARKRWELIKTHYPTDYLEFFRKSIKSSNQIEQRSLGFPLQKAVEFFSMFNDTERMISITQAGVDFILELMADMSLPMPLWFGLEQEIDTLDLLLQRLEWPSPLIRERAAVGIAELIKEDGNNQLVYRKVIDWIKEKNLESLTAIGLLTFIKALQLSPSLSFIKCNELALELPNGSIVIDRLLDEIKILTNSKEEVNYPNYKQIEIVDKNYTPGKIFTKYIETYLAPIYLWRAGKIKPCNSITFKDQWAYICELIIREKSFEFDANQAYYYTSGEYDERLAGFSPMLSEIYRSAFLRVLQYYFESGCIDKDFYLEYSYSTLPIDLSYWKISPNHIPTWWPSKKSNNFNENSKLVTTEMINSVESLLKLNINEQIIIAAEGAIINDPRGSNQPDGSFQLMAFGYNVLGSNLPTADEIAAELYYQPTSLIIPSHAVRPLSFLENSGQTLLSDYEPFIIKDLILQPLIVRSRDLVIGFWQYFRDYKIPYLLNNFFFNNIEMALEKELTYYDSNKQEIAYWSDWLSNFQERHFSELPMPCGQYVVINKKYLDKILSENDLRLGFVSTSNLFHKDYKGTEEYKDTKLHNVSSLIL